MAAFDWDALPGGWALKPDHGRGGCGILLARARDGAGWTAVGGRPLPRTDLLDHARLVLQGEFSPAGRLRDSVLLEPLLLPDDRFAEIAPAGMPDLRVVCHRGRPISAMLRLPTARSGGRANLHQGGLGAAVDVATGRVTGARWRGRPRSEHPDTGVPLVGLQVPAWREVLAEAAACAEVTGLGYLGVDMVFDRDRGRLVLEVNARPGLEIQNVQGWGLAEHVRVLVPGPPPVTLHGRSRDGGLTVTPTLYPPRDLVPPGERPARPSPLVAVPDLKLQQRVPRSAPLRTGVPLRTG